MKILELGKGITMIRIVTKSEYKEKKRHPLGAVSLFVRDKRVSAYSSSTGFPIPEI